MTLACIHRPPCPGCPRLSGTLDGHPALPPLAALAQEHGLSLERLERPALQHRVRSRLAVRGRVREPLIGLFEARSHWVVDIPECLVHHAAINAAANALRTAIQISGVAPYNERTHRGLVRYVQLVVERSTARVQVVLVGNCEEPSAMARLIEVLREQLGERLHSVSFSAQTARSNAILGPSCELLHGLAATEERIAGARVFFPPDAYGQSHLALYEDVVARIGARVPDGANVLELYAGVGAIGLSLIERASHVRFNELSPGSLRGLALGIDALAPALRARTEVLPGSAADQIGAIDQADVVIVDPPRKGLVTALSHALAARPPKRIIYLSCDTTTLLRDLAILLNGGRTRLVSLTACDFFPFTEHVETLAVLDRIE